MCIPLNIGGKPLFQMTVSDVFQFFLFCNFETAGVVAGRYPMLVYLYICMYTYSQPKTVSCGAEDLGIISKTLI